MTTGFNPGSRIFSSHKQAALAVADVITDLLREKPDAVLGLATGGTQEPVYEDLVLRNWGEELDFSRTHFFNLDEYIGVPPDHPQSFHAYMRQNFFDHVNVNPENIHIPDGCAANIERECLAYEAKIRAAGGIDLQILGIGTNGHIGFCEPGVSLGGEKPEGLCSCVWGRSDDYGDSGRVVNHGVGNR